MSDNATPYKAKEYDRGIKQTIPYYENLHKETIDLISNYPVKVEKWLDIGGGTGGLIERAYPLFKDTLFILGDTSQEMLKEASSRLANFSENNLRILPPCFSQRLNEVLKEKVQVITAIQVHHYLSFEERIVATKQCYEALEPGGIYITFENIKPLSEMGIQIGLKRWGAFQEAQGKSSIEVEQHKARFNKEYYPITLLEHFEVLKQAGFTCYELFWQSYMQVGLFAVKA